MLLSLWGNNIKETSFLNQMVCTWTTFVYIQYWDHFTPACAALMCDFMPASLLPGVKLTCQWVVVTVAELILMKYNIPFYLALRMKYSWLFWMKTDLPRSFKLIDVIMMLGVCWNSMILFFPFFARAHECQGQQNWHWSSQLLPLWEPHRDSGET